ncbi:MAG: fumarylacetoacetate hydrolase family protein, partial [Betaproteobacteria bacterium]
MKLATFNYRGRRFLGRVSARAQTVTPLRMAADERGLTPLIEAMVEGKPGFPPEDAPLPLAEVCLEAPIPRPRRNVFCIGLNYRSHAAELAARGFNGAKTADDLIPAAPVVFSKVPESVIGPGMPIAIPAASSAIDYEAELAVVIGKGGRGIALARGMAVAGVAHGASISRRPLAHRILQRADAFDLHLDRGAARQPARRV